MNPNIRLLAMTNACIILLIGYLWPSVALRNRGRATISRSQSGSDSSKMSPRGALYFQGSRSSFHHTPSRPLGLAAVRGPMQSLACAITRASLASTGSVSIPVRSKSFGVPTNPGREERIRLSSSPPAPSSCLASRSDVNSNHTRSSASSSCQEDLPDGLLGA